MKRILFCDIHFPAAYSFVRQLLADLGDEYEVLQCEPQDIAEEIATAAVVIPFMARITRELLLLAPELKLVIQFGVGLEGVDVEAATERGVLVSRIPSGDNGNAQSCAEHAIFLALALLRDVNGMKQSIERGLIGYPLGRTIYKSRALVYGYGGIGKALVSRLRAFGAHVAVVRRSLDESDLALCSESLHFMDVSDFRARVHETDLVFICTDQNPQTFQLVDQFFLSRLSKGAILINVARGGLLHYDDVLGAVQSGHLEGVGLDVFQSEPMPTTDNPFLNHPRVILTPHVAGVTEVSYTQMAKQLVGYVDDLLQRSIIPAGAVNADAIAAMVAKQIVF